MTDLACRHRGAEVSPGRFVCASPKLIVGAAGVDLGTCAICPYRDHEPVPETRPPSLLQQGLTFARALAAHAASGFAHVSEEVYDGRRALCVVCPHRLPLTDVPTSCGKCGCGLMGNLLNKLLWKSESCPDAPPRW
jgi:hypothetical protein